MKKKIVYICYDKSNMDVQDKALADNYWAVDFDNDKYEKPLEALSNIYGLSVPKLNKVIKKHYKATSLINSFRCRSCNMQILETARRPFLQRLDSGENFECPSCIKKQVIKKEVLKERTARLLINKFLSKGTYSISDLTLVEKIFLWAMFNSQAYISLQQQFLHDESSVISSSIEIDHIILSNLVDKGILITTNDIKFSTRLVELFEMESSTASIAYFLIKPMKYHSITDLAEAISDAIKLGINDKAEIEEFEFISQALRTHQLYDCLEYYAEKNKLEIENNNRLDNLMQYMAKNYSLLQCLRVMRYECLKVAAYIHIKQPEYFKRPRLVANSIDNYLTNALHNQWTINSDKYTPIVLNVSEFESESARLMSKLNWMDLSIQEVIATFCELKTTSV